ncbi:unnamed protein product [Spodoptera littoralis]|uniref:Uncharacterized protein n=1 Tax=Spodoptera littoralis TaxID=7109 RepID=A0A9P0N036_SPOLI|nr:unnamed protein product [Spodoptera littoralis]CAH1636534.1 unnamed protein product [Spodoptera littoralis]
MFPKQSLLLVFTTFVLCEAGFLETLPKCKINDNECKKGLIQSVIKNLAKTGLPEKGIPKIDPLSINNVSMSIADVIDLTLIDGIAKGIKDCTVNKFTASIEDECSTIEMTCDVTIKGRYKVYSASPFIKAFSGGETVEGEGNGKVKIEKLFLRFDFDHFFQKRGGKVYLKFKSNKLKYQYDIKGKMMFFADSLYIGGKECSKSVMDVMNQNWKFLMTSFGKPFMDKSMDFVTNFLEKYFGAVSADYMFDEDLTQYARSE